MEFLQILDDMHYRYLDRTVCCNLLNITVEEGIYVYQTLFYGNDSHVLKALYFEFLYDKEAGYSIENIDVTVICERPKLRPFVELIRSSLAELMSIGIGRISVKGKTNEGMDAVGAGKGIAVHAVALLK